jgi:hypothetical protein
MYFILTTDQQPVHKGRFSCGNEYECNF